jgi:hypothetical protein
MLVVAMPGIQQRATSNTVDRKSRFCVPPPGDGLVRFINEGREAGRPIWHAADDLAIPALTWTSEFHKVRSGPPPSLIPRTVLVAIRTGDNDAWALAIANERSVDVLRRLTAAAWRDVLGLSMGEVAELYPNAELEVDRKRSARRGANAGSDLWVRLGAWPWWGASSWGSADPEAWRAESLLQWRYGGPGRCTMPSR